jgi:hypothetical protein
MLHLAVEGSAESLPGERVGHFGGRDLVDSASINYLPFLELLGPARAVGSVAWRRLPRLVR